MQRDYLENKRAGLCVNTPRPLGIPLYFEWYKFQAPVWNVTSAGA